MSGSHVVLMCLLVAFGNTLVVDQKVVDHLVSVVVNITKNLSLVALNFEKHIYVISLV
jgi:hypothetical protein